MSHINQQHRPSRQDDRRNWKASSETTRTELAIDCSTSPQISTVCNQQIATLSCQLACRFTDDSVPNIAFFSHVYPFQLSPLITYVSRLVDEEDMCILPCVCFSHNLNFLLGGFQFKLVIDFYLPFITKKRNNKYYWH